MISSAEKWAEGISVTKVGAEWIQLTENPGQPVRLERMEVTTWQFLPHVHGWRHASEQLGQHSKSKHPETIQTSSSGQTENLESTHATS